jgi:hypothetical protein
MAKARKAAKSRKAKRKSTAKTKTRKASARKAKTRKSKPRKAAAKRKPARKRQKPEGVVDSLVDGVEAVQKSFEDSTKMREQVGTRWGIGEG